MTLVSRSPMLLRVSPAFRVSLLRPVPAPLPSTVVRVRRSFTTQVSSRAVLTVLRSPSRLRLRVSLDMRSPSATSRALTVMLSSPTDLAAVARDCLLTISRWLLQTSTLALQEPSHSNDIPNQSTGRERFGAPSFLHSMIDPVPRPCGLFFFADSSLLFLSRAPFQRLILQPMSMRLSDPVFTTFINCR